MFKKAEITQLESDRWSLRAWYRHPLDGYPSYQTYSDSPEVLFKILGQIIEDEKENTL